MDKISYGVLTPAYGRDYKARRDILKDINDGKDFTINMPNGSGYCSIADLADGDFQVRYKRNLNVCVVKIRNGVAS